MVKIQNVFFITGIIFLFATISYFSYQYVFGLADSIKAIILFLLTIVAFFIGVFLEERDV